MPSIYLDNNATTVLDERVRDVMLQFMGESLNPSSVHSFGRKARSIVEHARLKVADFANAKDCRVIFTSSGTEANNLAIKSFQNHKLFISSIEHPSVLKTALKYDGHIIPVHSSGVLDFDALNNILQEYPGKKILISVMLANNETGVIQPLKEVMEIASKHGALVHTDAVQCFGKVNVDMTELGVDMLTVSAHKFGGPQGAAALIVKKSVSFEPQIIGGGQEQNYRAGTENVAAIAGFGTAVEVCKIDETDSLRNKLENEIKLFAPEVQIFGEKNKRLPNTSYISMPGVSSETQLIHFDLDGIAVSAGSACSSGKIEKSHVLKAMGIENNIAETAVRVSFGKHNTIEDIETFIISWKRLYEKISRKKAA